jgi:hypothetical protein
MSKNKVIVQKGEISVEYDNIIDAKINSFLNPFLNPSIVFIIGVIVLFIITIRFLKNFFDKIKEKFSSFFN